MGRAAAVMMASVLLSRILGYARDAVIAYQHGAIPKRTPTSPRSRSLIS